MMSAQQVIFQHVFSESESGLIIIDTSFDLVNWNPWLTQHSGIKLEEKKGKNLVEIFPILEKSSVERAIFSAIRNSMSSVVSHTLNRKPFPLKNKAGQHLQQQIIIKPIILDDKQRYCLIQIMDISASYSREKQLIEQVKRTKTITKNLAEEKERAQVTLESIVDAVITTDEKGFVLSMNPAAELLIGVAEEVVQQKQVSDYFKLINEHTRAIIPCPVADCLRSKKIIANDKDHILLGKSKRFSIYNSVSPIINDDGIMLGTVLVFRDVTQSRALNEELNWQASHDSLTGLANRRQFELNMGALLNKAKSDNLQHHLLYLDLDQFKVVNDTCGHDAGDELLIQITEVLNNKLRKSDVLARLGGDEFGVLLESCSADNALAIANNLRQAVEDFRFGWQTKSFKIGVSIGIAEITGEEVKAAEVLSAADAACYSAKESGRNRVCFHEIDASATSVQQQEMQWVSRLQEALDNDGFELYLQRIQCVNSQKTPSNHYEVLLRKRCENGDIIPPGAFLPAAERFNLIGSVDTWVIENVFKKLEALRATNKYPGNLILSINLSGSSMANIDLLKRISYLLDESDFPAENFCFEVTETAAIANLKQATMFLSSLRDKGCKVALDDFGSGLSSFAYLKELPIDYLKIDGLFVKDIAVDNIDKAFVEAINQIAQVMNLETIAEFVENDEIMQILTEIGVNYVQGYGIHKPCNFDMVFPTQ
ncbi:MAG: EAL domain-containing protein [Methylococcales bacterium]